MRRLNLDRIQVDTTIKKKEIIKTSLEIPEVFRGVFKNNMIAPIQYKEVGDNVIYYDGENIYRLHGSTVIKENSNGSSLDVFTFEPAYLNLTQVNPAIDKNSDGGATKTGSVINYSFNGGTVTGTINVVDCGYDYFLCADSFNSKYYITLFPAQPTRYKEIKSWEIGGASVTLQTRYYINPFHELIDINDNKCRVGNKVICDVLFKDFIMSGDTNHVLYTAENDDGYFYSNLEYTGTKTFYSDYPRTWTNAQWDKYSTSVGYTDYWYNTTTSGMRVGDTLVITATLSEQGNIKGQIFTQITSIPTSKNSAGYYEIISKTVSSSIGEGGVTDPEGDTGISWLTNNCLLLATSSDGIYYGGFKVKKGDWSIDYYNNIPVQVSYKNKVMCNQVDYAYFSGSNVYIVLDEVTYRLDITSGVKLQIIDDRFIVVNSPATFNNTYDMLTGKSFCRNISYNGSILWTIPSNALIQEPEERGTFYVATGINIQGQIKDNPLQGTIWPSFPVYGLKDSNFQLLDIYNDASVATVEVYKGTKEAPTVPQFAFSLGGYKDLSGYIYPSSNNTLYSVSEIDTFSETNTGYQLIKTPVGTFINAMSNRQSFTFSYYLGTLSEFKEIFVLRGFSYGITDSGYVARMTMSKNTLVDVALVTKVGTMKLIGNTQEYALFYSPMDKTLRIFDSSLKLNTAREFSIAEPLYYTCRPEDDEIAIATSEGIYLFFNEGITFIESSVNQLKFCDDWLLAGDRVYSYYSGDSTLDIEYDSGKIGNSYDTSIMLDEVDIMLDDSELRVPAYLEYRIDIDESKGEVIEIIPDCKNVIRLKPTSTRSEGLYYRIWIKTNCNLMGISVQDNAEKKANLTRNNG